MRFLLLASAFAISNIKLTADKGGGSGGAAAKTDLEKLQDTEAEVKTLKQQLADANAGKTKAEGEKADAETAKTKAEGQVTALQTEKTELQNKLTKAEGEVTKLQGEQKTTDQRAQEIAAAHGSGGGSKDKTVVQNTGEKTGKELYAEYQKLNGLAAAEFWKTHAKALTAYGEEEARRERRRSEED